MPIYTEKIKDKKTGNMIDKLVGPEKQKQYYIRTYIEDEFGKKKQITRHNKEWVGLKGKREAQQYESALFSDEVIITEELPYELLLDKYKKEMKLANKESTLYTYESAIITNITPYFKGKDFRKLMMEDFQKWHASIDNKDYSIKYKKKLHTILVGIIDIGVKFFSLKHNYEKLLGTFKEKADTVITDDEKIRYITLENFQRFSDSIDNNMWKTFFNLLFYTGMRKGEVLALTWNDIDFINSQINVTKTLTTKTNEVNDSGIKFKITNTKNRLNRKVQLNKNFREMLLEYYYKEKESKDFNTNWFVFGRERFLPTTTIDEKKNFYFKKSNVTEITIHEFRHSHVSYVINKALQNNMDINAIFVVLANRLGHSIKVMQEVYMHLVPNIQNTITTLLDA